MMAKETTELICITCPMGCTLDVTHEGDTIVEVDGATCKRGENYAQEELTNPQRMVTTTVRVAGGLHPLVPVYTSAPIPKARIFDLLEEIRKAEVQAPVKMGEAVLEDVVGTDVKVLASRDMPAT
jgi:CxxC motif-containing protein